MVFILVVVGRVVLSICVFCGCNSLFMLSSSIICLFMVVSFLRYLVFMVVFMLGIGCRLVVVMLSMLDMLLIIMLKLCLVMVMIMVIVLVVYFLCGRLKCRCMLIIGMIVLCRLSMFSIYDGVCGMCVIGV